MRRRMLRLVTLAFLLVITLSYATVLLAKSPAPDTSLIIQKLNALQGDVSNLPTNAFKNPALAENKQNTLQNKLNAVIHQIQAGAFNGSINKLENDVKNTITNWITSEYALDLSNKVDEIIDLIKGKKPPTPDFTLKATPNSLTIIQNSSAQATITAQSINGFNQTVSLNVTSAPVTHVTTTLSQLNVTPPANGTANSTLTVKAAQNAQLGNFTLTVTGTSGTLKRAVNITLTITPLITVPDFTITTYPDYLVVRQGSSNMSVITVTSLVGFSQPVHLTVTSPPITGVNATVQPSPITPQPNQSKSSTLTVKAANTTALGNYTVTVTGSNGTLQHNVNIKLAVKEKAPEPKDTTAPTISDVDRTPATPTYNQSVAVTALVYDLESGIKQAKLNYTRGSTITIVNMTLAQGVYKAVIPAFAYNTTVEYRVLAFDNADNMAAFFDSYRVRDPYPPILRIDTPAQGNYVSGMVQIAAVIRDQNGGGESGFASAELSINGVIVKTYAPPIPTEGVVYPWNTVTFGPDGAYTIKLIARDRAGMEEDESLWVTVDNTLPSAVIEAPVDGSFLRLSTVVEVKGSDLNFDKMELHIDNKLVKTYLSSGSQVFEWNTSDYSDGVHSAALKVFDKAGNIKEALVNVVVDNSAPIMGLPYWSPREPEADEDVQVNVTVFEPAYGSGVANVTLQFKNGTMDEWLSVPMKLKDGNWTAVLGNQSDTVVEFIIVAFDRSGNRNETAKFEFTVAAPGFPLLWLLIIIIILLAILLGAIAYLYVRRRRKKREGEGAAVPPTMPPPSPGVEVSKPASVAAVPAAALAPVPSRGFGMVSFLVAAHNEEGTIAGRIGKAFERAASHKGSSEVIVVDDGSLDSTYELAWEAVKANRAKYPNIPAKVVKLSTYMGKEEAVRFGSRKATGEIIETVNGENTPSLPALMGHLLLTL